MLGLILEMGAPSGGLVVVVVVVVRLAVGPPCPSIDGDCSQGVAYHRETVAHEGDACYVVLQLVSTLEHDSLSGCNTQD